MTSDPAPQERRAPPQPAPEAAVGGGTSGGTRPSLGSRAAALWRPRPRTPSGAPPSARDIVNGLDSREMLLGALFAALSVVLAVAGYVYAVHSSNHKVHSAAIESLLAGLIGAALLAAGVLFRRRALLGFASFLVGMAYLLGGGSVLDGGPYLIFGGWLIFRVMRKQREDQGATRTSAAVSKPAATVRQAGPPKASKRYTPPKRAATRRR